MTRPSEELELKAVVPDPAALVRRLEAAGAVRTFAGTMTDRWYDRDGELTARDMVLRTRHYRNDGGGGASVLGWKGPTRISSHGYKLRDELEYQVHGDAPPDALLLALGYSVVHGRDRRIEVYRLGDATLRLEHYPRMDVLLEVEGTPEAIERGIAASGLPRQDFVADSLTEFLLRYEARTGQAAQVTLPHDAQ